MWRGDTAAAALSFFILSSAVAIAVYTLSVLSAERRGFDELRQAHRRVQAEQLANDFESAIRQDAERCLENLARAQATENGNGRDWCRNIASHYARLAPPYVLGSPEESRVFRTLAQDLVLSGGFTPGLVAPIAYPAEQSQFFVLPESGRKGFFALRADPDKTREYFRSACGRTGIVAELVPATLGGRVEPFRMLFPYLAADVHIPAPAGFPSAWRIGLMSGAAMTLIFGTGLLLWQHQRGSREVRARQQFVVDVAHQLKTPIARMRADVELLAISLPAEDVRTQSLEEVLQQLDYLNDRTSKALSYAKFERQREVLQLAPSDLRRVVQPVLLRYSSRFDELGVELSTLLRPAPCSFDISAVSEALSNLLDNALLHSGANVRIEVTTDRDEISAFIEVRDFGSGILPADRDRIFEPFQRAVKSRGGFGLGLAIVKRIMDGHRGTVSVAPEPGRGAAFRLSFPL